MSNEDTLSGYFQVDAFVKELVGILGGRSPVLDDDDGDDADEDRDEEDEDVALAAALAMSGGAVSHGDGRLRSLLVDVCTTSWKHFQGMHTQSSIIESSLPFSVNFLKLHSLTWPSRT